MKRTILALTIAGLSVAAYASPPPGGGPPTPIDVRVTNSAVPIQSAGTPAQVLLQGKFVNDDINLADTILGPRSFTIPSEFSRFLVRHVSCEVIVATGVKVQIFLDTNFSFTSSSAPGSLVQLMPDKRSSGISRSPGRSLTRRCMPTWASRPPEGLASVTHFNYMRSGIPRLEPAA